MKQFSVRLLSALLVLVMLITLAACGKEPAKDTATDGTTATTTAVSTEATTTSTTLDTTTTTADTEDTTAGDTTTTSTEENTTAPATTTDVWRPGPGPGDKPTAPTTTTTAPSTTGTKKPITGFIPSIPTTTTTTRPSTTKATTTTTVTTTKPTPKKPIHILAVGNSFSVDAMQKHMFKVLESLGYDEIILGNLYVAGCSIDTHWSNVSGKKKAYEYYETRPNNGQWKTIRNVTADKAFETVEWDVITVQQASPDSGRSGTFGNLSKLVAWLKEKSPNATILYHMTWAYQKDSTHWAFPAYYGSDQARMYNDIITATRDKAAKTEGIKGVIPVGTAIQNLRTSSLGDTLTSDGHHLLDSYGDYTAAVTWAAYITGVDANKVTYRPDEIADHFDEIAKSVNNAIKTPYSITAC